MASPMIDKGVSEMLTLFAGADDRRADEENKRASSKATKAQADYYSSLAAVNNEKAAAQEAARMREEAYISNMLEMSLADANYAQENSDTLSGFELHMISSDWLNKHNPGNPAKDPKDAMLTKQMIGYNPAMFNQVRKSFKKINDISKMQEHKRVEFKDGKVLYMSPADLKEQGFKMGEKGVGLIKTQRVPEILSLQRQGDPDAYEYIYPTLDKFRQLKLMEENPNIIPQTIDGRIEALDRVEYQFAVKHAEDNNMSIASAAKQMLLSKNAHSEDKKMLEQMNVPMELHHKASQLTDEAVSGMYNNYVKALNFQPQVGETFLHSIGAKGRKRLFDNIRLLHASELSRGKIKPEMMKEVVKARDAVKLYAMQLEQLGMEDAAKQRMQTSVLSDFHKSMIEWDIRRRREPEVYGDVDSWDFYVDSLQNDDLKNAGLLSPVRYSTRPDGKKIARYDPGEADRVREELRTVVKAHNDNKKASKQLRESSSARASMSSLVGIQVENLGSSLREQKKNLDRLYATTNDATAKRQHDFVSFFSDMFGTMEQRLDSERRFAASAKNFDTATGPIENTVAVVKNLGHLGATIAADVVPGVFQSNYDLSTAARGFGIPFQLNLNKDKVESIIQRRERQLGVTRDKFPKEDKAIVNLAQEFFGADEEGLGIGTPSNYASSGNWNEVTGRLYDFILSNSEAMGLEGSTIGGTTFKIPEIRTVLDGAKIASNTQSESLKILSDEKYSKHNVFLMQNTGKESQGRYGPIGSQLVDQLMYNSVNDKSFYELFRDLPQESPVPEAGSRVYSTPNTNLAQPDNMVQEIGN